MKRKIRVNRVSKAFNYTVEYREPDGSHFITGRYNVGRKVTFNWVLNHLWQHHPNAHSIEVVRAEVQI